MNAIRKHVLLQQGQRRGAVKRVSASVIRCLCLWLVSGLTIAGVCADEHEKKVERWKQDFEQKVLPIIESRCLSCHRGEKSEGEFDLSRFPNGNAAVDAGDAWDRVARRIRLNEMPPQGSPGLNDEQKGHFQRWVDSRPSQDLCKQLASEETQSWYRGYVMSRRLTQLEYRNAIRDLTGMGLPAGDEPPVDGAGGEGFDTVGDSLFTSTIHLESYLSIADRLIDEALPLEATVSGAGLLKTGKPLPGLDVDRWNSVVEEHRGTEAAQVVESFARRAWRRPVSVEETTRLMSLYESTLTRTQSPALALREPLKAILVSPHFLFVVETEPEESGVLRLTPHQLATRLSLFLWSSIPDEELLTAADMGLLYDEGQYRSQIRRMLSDPRARALGENFGLQWLGLRNFEGVKPDLQVYPEYTADLARDLADEAVNFVTLVFRENRPLTDLISANYVVVNGRLAQYYGLNLAEDATWQTVSIADGRRGGVTTMASVLTSSSYPRRTSPVLRGRWILDELLGTPVPPPPPNVPALEETSAVADSQTVRQRLEVHRQKPECASCHNRMDPLGFGLENFDGIGRWRESEGSLPIDSAGQLPSGETFSGPEQLKAVLLKRSDEFLQHFARKLLGFALGRELNKFDACVVESGVKRLKENGFQSHVLIEEIALSYPFQYRYYKKSEPVPDPARSRGARFLEALQRLSQKADEVRKKAEAEKASQSQKLENTP
ncbi:MAG: DUF1592 domain-containing protein [Planctomycetia bacterium]